MPNPPNITNITPPRVALIDERTGAVSREWYRFFYNLYYAVGGTNAGAIPPSRGGTGTTQIPTDGDLLIGNGTTGTYNATQIDLGDGLAKLVGPGSLELSNTGVLSNIAGDGIAVDQATGDVTISNTGVLSIIAGEGIDVDQATGDVTVTSEGTVKTVSIGTNANFYLTFVDSNNATAAYEAVYTDAGITYNPSTNAITSGISGGTF